MNILYYIIVWTFGAVFGSFASAIIPRIREKKDFVAARSECPNCRHTLGVLDLFPIFSYILLLGKCRYCKARIPAYHFLLELSMSALFVLIAWKFTDFASIASGSFANIGELGFLFAAAFVTIVFCAYDLLYMEIPDELLIPFLILAFVGLGSLHLSGAQIPYMITFENPTWNSALVQGMLWAVPIFLFFLAMVLGSNGRWMGGGDLRAAVFMGFVGGAKIAWLWLFLSYITGSIGGLAVLAVYRRRNIMIPFWPYLGLGLWLALFLYEPILNWYWSFLN